jgi:hypothetical protein
VTASEPTPTQVAHPGRATARTAVQGILGLIVVVGALQADGTLPENLPWIGGALAVIVILARIMAHPAVNAWLRSVGLSAEP